MPCTRHLLGSERSVHQVLTQTAVGPGCLRTLPVVRLGLGWSLVLRFLHALCVSFGRGTLVHSCLWCLLAFCDRFGDGLCCHAWRFCHWRFCAAYPVASHIVSLFACFCLLATAFLSRVTAAQPLVHGFALRRWCPYLWPALSLLACLLFLCLACLLRVHSTSVFVLLLRPLTAVLPGSPCGGVVL